MLSDATSRSNEEAITKKRKSFILKECFSIGVQKCQNKSYEIYFLKIQITKKAQCIKMSKIQVLKNIEFLKQNIPKKVAKKFVWKYISFKIQNAQKNIKGPWSFQRSNKFSFQDVY